MFLGGRGAGKTRAGAEWLRTKALSGAPRMALVGPTLADVREVMIDGPAGLIAVAHGDDDRPSFEPSRRRLVWPNGAVALAFSAEEPDRIRGSEVSFAWCDEFCAWRNPDEALAMLQLALRAGERPQLVVTTTPRPIAALKSVMTAGDTVVTRAPTRSNAANLSGAFLEAVERAYGSTALGRQELDGEIVEDRSGALWTRAGLAAVIDLAPPAFDRVVVGVDPPASVGPQADACGIIVAGACGYGHNRNAWVLADRTVHGATPDQWAGVVAQAAEAFGANAIVAEVNQGGAMVSDVLRLAAPDFHVRSVCARQAKRARAEPIAAAYAQGRVKHAGRFRELEDQMCAFDGLRSGGRSPDRVDALVWALWDLLMIHAGEPRMRVL